MSALSEFLSARLYEIEAAARHSSGITDEGRHWSRVHGEDESTVHAMIGNHRWTVATCEYDGDAHFIAAHDPAFTLAWVEALRRVVAGHAGVDMRQADAGEDFEDRYVCSTCYAGEAGHPDDVACPTLRSLASAWKAHPDWLEEWV